MTRAQQALQWWLEAYRLVDHPEEERLAHAATWRDEWSDWATPESEEEP